MNEAERELDHLLRIVADQVDLDHCRRVDERYRRALSWEEVDAPPLVVQAGFGSVIPLPEPWSRFRHYPYRETFAQPAAMLQNMLLERVVPGLILKDDNPLAVRNNHGVVQLASALTGTWSMVEDDYPWLGRLDSLDRVREVAGGEGLDPAAGLLPVVAETLAFYREALARYPVCRETVQISLPDLQGPMDTAEQLWGSEIHYAFTDEPELLARLLSRIVDAMVLAWRLLRPYAINRLEALAHTQHGYQVPGRLMVRNDSSTLLSGRTYARFIRPHDARLLDGVGGGTIHFCGNGQHLVGEMLAIPGLRGLDFGQPDQMDVAAAYAMCREKRVALTHLIPTRDDLLSGDARRDFPTGAVFVYQPTSLDDAQAVLTAHRRCQ